MVRKPVRTVTDKSQLALVNVLLVWQKLSVWSWIIDKLNQKGVECLDIVMARSWKLRTRFDVRVRVACGVRTRRKLLIGVCGTTPRFL